MDASRTGFGSEVLDTERGCRGPVLRAVETPRSRLLSRGYRGLDVVEKEELCCEGARREAMRQAVGGRCILPASRSRRIVGRKIVGVDMIMSAVNSSMSSLIIEFLILFCA